MGNDESLGTFLDILKNRQFFRLWLAQFVSNFGDWLALLALFSLIAFRWRGTPYQVSGMMIAFIIPVAFLGPIAGVFVDRWNLKWTMVSSDLIRAVLATLLAFAAGLRQIYCLVFVLSAVSCFFMPAQTVAIPLLVRKEQLLTANAVNTQATQLNKVISPAIAGVLVAWTGEELCFYLDSATFLFSAAMLARLALDRKLTGTSKDTRSIVGELLEGLEFLLTRQTILFVVLSMVTATFAVGACEALIVVYVRDILSAKSQFFGALVSCVSVGTILGALLISRFGQSQSKVHMVVLGILGLGIGIFVLAASGRKLVALLCSLWLGFAVASVLIPSQTLVQEETPPTILGRVSSTSTSLMTVSQLVAVAIAGAIAGWIGIRNLYYLVALILCLTGFVGYFHSRAHQVAEAKEHP